MAEILRLFTTEKRDVLSAKSLTLEVIFSDKSLIHSKKNRGSKIDPCGTPAFTGNQFHDCPLSITRWNLLSRTLLTSARTSPVMPTRLSLYINPSCHTLSKAFDISRNTPRTSRVVHINIWKNVFHDLKSVDGNTLNQSDNDIL